MKKNLITLLAIALATMAASAAQKDVSLQDIAHPRLLEGVLDSNFDELYTEIANVSASDLANGDYGEFTVTSGFAVIDDMAVDETELRYDAVAISATSTGAVSVLDLDYFDESSLIRLVVTTATDAVTFNIAEAPGLGNLSRPVTLVNTSTSVVTIGHNSLLYPAADLVMKGQWDAVTIAGYSTDMWVRVNSALTP
ncbi:MAG: hypothetical protein KBC05_17890 [Candidatus Hydrogenedentes bacterium]|nr:hypothetical protein [Candidatus Hydrogenedentota bacterium]